MPLLKNIKIRMKIFIIRQLKIALCIIIKMIFFALFIMNKVLVETVPNSSYLKNINFLIVSVKICKFLTKETL